MLAAELDVAKKGLYNLAHRLAQILVRFNASLTEDESPVVCEHDLLPFSRPIKEGV